MFLNIGHCWTHPLPRSIPYVKLGLKSINHIFKNWRRIYRWEKCDCAPFSSLGNNVNQRKLRWDEWSMRVYEHLNGRQFKLWILWPFGKTGCTRIKDDVHVLIHSASNLKASMRTYKTSSTLSFTWPCSVVHFDSSFFLSGGSLFWKNDWVQIFIQHSQRFLSRVRFLFTFKEIFSW